MRFYNGSYELLYAFSLSLSRPWIPACGDCLDFCHAFSQCQSQEITIILSFLGFQSYTDNFDAYLEVHTYKSYYQFLLQK